MYRLEPEAWVGVGEENGCVYKSSQSHEITLQARGHDWKCVSVWGLVTFVEKL